MAYTQVTLATLRAQLQRKWEATPYWVDAEANFAINEGLRVWNLLTGVWKRRELLTTVAATATSYVTGFIYSLSSTMTYNVRVQWKNEEPLARTSLHDLNNGRTNWRTEITTAGGSVPTEPTTWAPVGLQRIAIWPGDAAGGNNLTVDAVRNTPTLVNDWDLVDMAQSDHLAVLNYALHISTFKLGGAVFQNTMPLYREFLRSAAEQNGRLRTSLFFRRAMGQDTDRIARPMSWPPQVDQRMMGQGGQ